MTNRKTELMVSHLADYIDMMTKFKVPTEKASIIEKLNVEMDRRHMKAALTAGGQCSAFKKPHHPEHRNTSASA